MEKITKFYDVYDFEELDEEIKNKLIEQQREFDYECYLEFCLHDDLEEEAKRLLTSYFENEKKFNDVEYDGIYYSFSYSQGDGGGIEFDGNYKNKYFKVRHRNNFYYHYKTFLVESDELDDLEIDELQKIVDDVNREFERIGWNAIEYEPSLIDIVEVLKENKYLKDGTIFHN